MRALWLALLLSFCVCAQASSDVPASIRMASDVWVDRINPDGTGMSWDILRMVFEPADRVLHLKYGDGPATKKEAVKLELGKLFDEK